MTPGAADPLLDAAGRRLAPAGPAPRIVSLVPSLTELLFALGLGERVVGRTAFCVHPRREVERVPVVGGTKTVDMEAVRALAPTHAVLNVDENLRRTAGELEALGVETVVTHPLAPEDNRGLYRLLGRLFDRGAAAESLVERFDAALARLRAAAPGLPRRRVLYLIWRQPWMTVSRATYVSATLALVRWETVADDPERRYPEIELDADRLAGTDLVLLSSEPFPFRQRHLEEVRRIAGLEDPEIRGPRVELFDGEIASWYGSRAIEGLDRLRALAAALAA